MTKKNILYTAVGVVALILTTASCGQVTMVDASSEPKYAAIIGKQFRVKEDLWAIGVTSDKNYKQDIDYIVLKSGVGFSGPEVVAKGRLEKGSIIKIVRVLKAKSAFISRVKYVVEVINTEKYRHVEVRVKPSGDVGGPNYGLDKSVYEFIDS